LSGLGSSCNEIAPIACQNLTLHSFKEPSLIDLQFAAGRDLMSFYAQMRIKGIAAVLRKIAPDAFYNRDLSL